MEERPRRKSYYSSLRILSAEWYNVGRARTEKVEGSLEGGFTPRAHTSVLTQHPGCPPWRINQSKRSIRACGRMRKRAIFVRLRAFYREVGSPALFRK